MVRVRFSRKESYFVVSFTAAFLLFLLLIYLPKLRELKEIKDKLAKVQKEFKDIEGLSPDIDSGEFMKALEEKAKFLSEKFPVSEEEAIKNISRAAAKNGLKLTSLKSSVQNVDLKKEIGLSLSGRTVRRAYLDIDIFGDYLHLGKFLKELRAGFRNLVVLDKLHIDKISGQGNLKIHLGLYLYLIV